MKKNENTLNRFAQKSTIQRSKGRGSERERKRKKRGQWNSHLVVMKERKRERIFKRVPEGGNTGYEEFRKKERRERRTNDFEFKFALCFTQERLELHKYR